METNLILQADVLDILFERRNKMYGAYELRKSYNKRLKTAIGVMMGCCLLAFVAAVAAKNNGHTKTSLIVQTDVNLVTAEPPKQPVPPPPPPTPPPAPKPIATIKFTTLVLDNNTDVPPPPAQSNLDNIAIGTINKEGTISDEIPAPPVEIHGTGNVVAPRVDEFKGEVFFVQQEARFPGGADAWKRFLERNLKADIPLDNGAPIGTYTVIVSFLVDKEGNISEIKALNDPGFGTAAEAIRAIQKGPKWIPALQNGRNVIYRQKQAITFKVEEVQ